MLSKCCELSLFRTSPATVSEHKEEGSLYLVLRQVVVFITHLVRTAVPQTWPQALGVTMNTSGSIIKKLESLVKLGRFLSSPQLIEGVLYEFTTIPAEGDKAELSQRKSILT